MQDNVEQISLSDHRLNVLYTKIWEAIEEANDVNNPLTWAAIAGIIGMVHAECNNIMLGLEDPYEQ